MSERFITNELDLIKFLKRQRVMMTAVFLALDNHMLARVKQITNEKILKDMITYHHYSHPKDDNEAELDKRKIKGQGPM